MLTLVDENIEQYAQEYTKLESHLLKKLTEETHAKMAMPQMLTGRLEGRLLNLLVKISNAAFVLELGTFTGYSTLCMAEAVPDNGRIITCEVDPIAAKIANDYFSKSPHGHKITIKLAPALETIKTISEQLDFIFIDADKSNYPIYYEELLPKLKSGGLMVIDNTLWSGKVLSPQKSTDRAIHDLNQTIFNDKRVENVILTVRDGINIVRKL